MKYLIKFLLTFLITFSAIASKNKCNYLYTFGQENLSNSPFIPLSTFLESEKNKYVVRSWALKRNAKSIGPGISVMYRTANDAAQKVLASLRLSHKNVYKAPKPSGNIIKDFAHTIEVMRTRKYKYIQNALVLLPSKGVYTILPLAQYDKVNDTYIPIVIKGHQDLKKSDIITAAITAYAVGPFMGGIPETAKVSLRPVVAKRRSTNINESEHKVFVKNEYVRIEEIYQNFIAEHKAFQERLVLESNKFFTENPLASDEEFVKKTLEPLLTPQKNELSQIPYGAKKHEAAALAKYGYTNKQQLSKLDINSNDFLELSMMTNISPSRLKHLHNKSLAFVKDEILITKPYKDPGSDLDYVVHFDIEANYDPDVRSGAYSFGVQIQSQKTIGEPVKDYVPGDKNPDQFFIHDFPNYGQESVDLIWSKLFKLFRTDKRLKNKRYLINEHSPFEDVKINQEFDIRRDLPENFSKADRESTILIKGVEYPLYFERNIEKVVIKDYIHLPETKVIGYHIRRTEFFEKFPGDTPYDVMNYKDKLYDTLDFFRHNTSVPTRTNGLKSLLHYVQKHLPPNVKRFEYANGDNGLNCIAWYNNAIKKQCWETFNRTLIYLGIDIDGARMLWNFVRSSAKKPILPEVQWTLATKEKLAGSSNILKRKKFLASTVTKATVLNEILGKPLSSLTDGELSTLAEILDRSSYLGNRKSLLNDKRMSKERIRAILNHKRHGFETKRKKLFIEFVSNINPEINTELMSDKTQDALYYLTTMSSNQTSQHIINRALAYDQIRLEVDQYIAENMVKTIGEEFDTNEVNLALQNPIFTEKLKNLRKKHYRLLKFNKVENPDGSGMVKEYGFGPEFEKYEAINMKQIWEAVLIEYLLKDLK